MNFTEMETEVVSIVKRPDKILDIRRQLNAALNFYCIEGNFARDKDEQAVVLDGNLYAQSILLSLFTRFRKVDAIVLPYRTKPLEHVEPKVAFAKGGCPLTDVYYLAGDQINIKQSTVAVTANVAYYKYPPVLSGVQTHWLTEVSPYLLIDKAASAIFFNIGDDTSGKYHKGLADEAFTSAKRDYKHGVNYG